jgi:type I restriction enzyme S subunit
MHTYLRQNCAVFLKTKEKWGELSNMAGGMPLAVVGISIMTSEALYQACRFPELPDVQAKIIAEKSPMSAKMVGKPFRSNTRSDWDDVHVDIMRWCLQIKARQNWATFASVLVATGSTDIVEETSKRDTYWGAKKASENPDVLIGQNVLGRLLMELRREIVLGGSNLCHCRQPVADPELRSLREGDSDHLKKQVTHLPGREGKRGVRGGAEGNQVPCFSSGEGIFFTVDFAHKYLGKRKIAQKQ